MSIWQHIALYALRRHYAKAFRKVTTKEQADAVRADAHWLTDVALGRAWMKRPEGQRDGQEDRL